jgi:hypothetical protein
MRTVIHIFCISALLLTGTNCWCAKKVTVAQLEDILHTMQEQKKADPEVATALKQLEPSQELTGETMNRLINLVPGPLSTAQLYVLEALSADLAPPDSDLPNTAAPDAAQQKAILDKTSAYVASIYSQLPKLVATKTTLRFQDNVEAVGAGSGLQSGAQEATVSSGFSKPPNFLHYINSSEMPVSSEHGTENPPEQKQGVQWGANKMIAIETPDPSLPQVVHEAETAESIHWLRWELINGKPAAVFAFAVPRERSHLEVKVCCFPKINQTGDVSFSMYSPPYTGEVTGHSSGVGQATGNFQTNTTWHGFKAIPPYHGELFVNASTGIVVRMIVQAEFKTTEVVRELNSRIDFAPVEAGDKVYVLPMKTFVDSLVVPSGDSGAATYNTRRTLLTSAYKDYKVSSK